MSKKIKASELPEFDMAEQLKSDEDIAAYLTIVMEEGDEAELFRALGYIAKAKGMAAIAEKSGLGRESLYKALRPGAKPQFVTVMKVLKAVGIDLAAVVRDDNHAVA